MKKQSEKYSQNEDVKNISLIMIGKEILKKLEREATINEIYEMIEDSRELKTLRTNPNWRADLRFAFLQHCSDSRYYTGNEDLFYRKKTPAEVWGLRQKFQTSAGENDSFIDDLFIKEKIYQKLNTILLKEKNLLIPIKYKSEAKNQSEAFLSFIKDTNGDCRSKQISLNNFFTDSDVSRSCSLLEKSFYPFSQEASKQLEIPCYYIISDVDKSSFKKNLLDLLVISKKSFYLSNKTDIRFSQNLYTILFIEENSPTYTFAHNIFKKRFTEYDGLYLLSESSI